MVEPTNQSEKARSRGQLVLAGLIASVFWGHDLLNLSHSQHKITHDPGDANVLLVKCPFAIPSSKNRHPKKTGSWLNLHTPVYLSNADGICHFHPWLITLSSGITVETQVKIHGQC